MRYRTLGACFLALMAAACGTSEPRTLQGAVVAAQLKISRYTSGNYAEEWLRFDKRFREAIRQDDYVNYATACAKRSGRTTGLPSKLTGARLQDDDTAVVRVEYAGTKRTQVMIYEDGRWVGEPSPELAKNLGKPVGQWTC
jgi:hypothetical protein